MIILLSILGLLTIWVIVSFYLPTRFMRSLISGMKDIKKGRIIEYKHDEFMKEMKKELQYFKKHPIRAKLMNFWYKIRTFYFNLPDFPRDIYNEIKWSYQRITKGWSNRDAWSVGGHISRLTYEMLKHHKKVAHGYAEILPLPKEIIFGSNSKIENKYYKDCQKAWNETLDKMIYAFKLNTQIAEGERENYCDPKILKKMKPSSIRLFKYLSKEEELKRQEGMKLFIEHLHKIWD